MEYYQKWSEERIKDELNKIINDIGYLPSSNELYQINTSLIYAIKRYGGINKFRTLMGYDLLQKHNYWNNITITEELNLIIKKLGHFPSQNELSLIKRNDLCSAIINLGGFNKFRQLLEYKFIQKPKGYWNDELIIKELQNVINDINRFPTYKDLCHVNRYDLYNAISKHGGIIKFRKLFGYNFIKRPNGYWTEERVLLELKKIKEQLGHFPSPHELEKNNNSVLISEICKRGGFLRFQELCGENASLHSKYISKLYSYVSKRGKSSETIVKQILRDYCILHNLHEPQYNVKLSKGNVLEFVCNTGKTIGIDVTNTRQKRNIKYKYTKKSYHNHLDELWIVVFGEFTEEDYIKFNQESPDNVKVMSIHEFLDELDYSIDEHTKNKIYKYNQCTFHTKDQFLLENKNEFFEETDKYQ